MEGDFVKNKNLDRKEVSIQMLTSLHKVDV